MKDFQDFKKTLSKSKLDEIYKTAEKRAYDCLNNASFADRSDKFWTICKEMSSGITLGLLEEYHQWLEH